jgi:MFS family permease
MDQNQAVSLSTGETLSTSVAYSRNTVAWAICGVAILYYCYAFFLRVSPGAMTHELMQGFHIRAAQLGLFSSLYYWAYTFMQLPGGFLLDRFGPRLVMFGASLVCVMGLGLFVSTDNYGLACVGRFMMGFGSAFAYISSLKLATLWLPPNRFAMMAGLTTSLGMVAGIFAENYLTVLVKDFGYKDALYSALIAGMVLSFFIILIVRNKPATGKDGESIEKASFGDILQGLFNIIKMRQMWLIGIIGALLYLPASVFLDLWGISYLETAHGVTSGQAAKAVSMIFVGWLVSAPVIGAISDIVERRRAPLLACSIVAFLLMSYVFYGPQMSLASLYVAMFVLGIVCGSHPLCFCLGKENNPHHLAGVAVAATNMLIMLGGVIFQPVVGCLLDLHSSGQYDVKGLPIYTPSDYTWAISVIPIGLLLAIILTPFLKETYCQETDQE